MLGLAVLSAACGKPTPGAGGDDASTTDVGSETSVANNGVTTTNNGASTACADIGGRFTDAVRAIGRDCVTDADCKLLSRAQACDCELAVTASADTAAYEAVRAEADAAQCANPFGCPTGECPYRRLSDPGELYAHCNAEGQCEVVQLMSCADYETKLQGGIAPASGCADDNDCTTRNDLNPCDCAEAVSVNFPFLTVQAIYEMIAINDARCNATCVPCPPPGTPTCTVRADESQVCEMR